MNDNGNWDWTIKRIIFTILISLYIIGLFILIFVGVYIEKSIFITIGISMLILPLPIFWFVCMFQWVCELIKKGINKIIKHKDDKNVKK